MFWHLGLGQGGAAVKRTGTLVRGKVCRIRFKYCFVVAKLRVSTSKCRDSRSFRVQGLQDKYSGFNYVLREARSFKRCVDRLRYFSQTHVYLPTNADEFLVLIAVFLSSRFYVPQADTSQSLLLVMRLKDT